VGTVLAGRFTLEALVGRGGMGIIYRATDALSGQPVALKLLHTQSADALQRFSREAAVLAKLRHPGIVSYIAQGATPDGSPFLAMEWLEGEDLARRLARQPLSLEEALALLRNTSQALALAHQHGVIHRDLKPSNLFLRNGRPEDVVLLDFGLARHQVPSLALTASQMVLGTPGYMAPEQASAQSQLTPSADLFSLGCIFYECLTGRPPFSAPHFVAALAKILFTEPEPLRSLRPELPEALEVLLQRMLAKAPAQRFPEASRLLEALDALDAQRETGSSTTAPGSTPALRLSGAEQQLVSVLLAAPLSTEGQPAKPQDSGLALRDALRPLLLPHGAQVELLADGSLVATLAATHGSATDPASLAARCALFLQERWPRAAIVLTTGRGHLRLPVGEAVDRAGQLLRQLESLPPSPLAPVLLDDVTAGLLGPRFQLTRSQHGLFLLHGERLGADESRQLLGKPTPCVGRTQELALLELAFTTCVQDPSAQAFLITAPAGVGKSRLRHEFLRRLERHEPPVLVLLGRGDPMSAGSADGLLAQALRRLCGLSGGEPLGVRREKLSQRLAQHLPASQAPEVTAFLGELCGIPFPDEHSAKLRAARGDPRLMSLHVSRALVAFLQAECAHHPVVLVLEDLHWGDTPSVRLMDEALRELAEQPFLVLALARPEVRELLPGPWLQRMQVLQLPGLSAKAGASLMREVLGPELPSALVERLTEQAAGNALFLEELIRGVAEGRGEAAPRTVLAMLQARLGRLEAQARQALLAASFLGRTFWTGGVQALLGKEQPPALLEHHLRQLVEQELIERQPVSRFPPDTEYRFRHALMRDAAYALVPDSHKPDGHCLAGQWLEQQGETDPRVLAEHFHRGQQLERAAHFYAETAERLFERRDLPGTLRCVETALECAPSSHARSRLRALHALTLGWMANLPTMLEQGLAVLPELREGDFLWCRLVGNMIGAGGLLGLHEEVARLGMMLAQTEPESSAIPAWLDGLSLLSCAATWTGARPEAAGLLERMEAVAAEVIAREASARGWVCLAQGFFHHLLEDKPWQALVWAEQGTSAFLEAGAENNSITTRGLIGQALVALGDISGAVEQLRLCLATSLPMDQPITVSISRTQLALALTSSPAPEAWEEARTLALAELADPGPRMHVGLVHGVLARVALRHGELAEAERHAREACEHLASFTSFRLYLRPLCAVLLAQGRIAEAREVAALNAREWEALGGTGAAAVGVYLDLAEACLADGDTAAGEAALRTALRSLHSRARDIPDEAARERFHRQVPENARALELARQRSGETAGA
jgi:serine/threonine protein kinase